MHHDKRAKAQQLAAQVNRSLLVERINILIAALIGYLVLPRALARLWKKSEWSEGHMLQCKAKNGNPIPNLGDAIKENVCNESTSAATRKPHLSHNRRIQQLVDSEWTLRSTYPRLTPSWSIYACPSYPRVLIYMSWSCWRIWESC